MKSGVAIRELSGVQNSSDQVTAASRQCNSERTQVLDTITQL